MPGPVSAVYRFGEFQLNVAARRLSRGGAAVSLTPKSFDVLQYLVEQAGRIVTRDAMLRAVWPDTAVDEGNLSQQIFAVRRALGNCSSYVVTLPGRGYQFTEPVERVDLQEEASSLDTAVAAAPVAAVTMPVAEHAAAAVAAAAVTVAEAAAPMPAAGKRRPWLIPVLAGAAALALCGAAVWTVHRHTSQAQPKFLGLVLADFQNTTGDPNLDSTLREAMEIALGQSSYFEILGRGEVGSVLKQMEQDPQSALTPGLAREVCERSNQDVLITGTVSRLGSRYLLTTQATACGGGKLLAGSQESVNAPEDLLAAVDRSTRSLRKGLGESAASLRKMDVPLEQATTHSIEALRLYSAGATVENRGVDLTGAIRLYLHALELDPNFAVAWQALSKLYYTMNEPAKAADAARKAFERSERVSDRERFAIRMHFHADAEEDLPAAIAVGREWAAAYPHDWRPLALMTGEFNDLNRFSEAVVAGREALAISDHQALIYSDLARAERRLGHWAAVEQLGQEATQHGVDSNGLHTTLFQNAFATENQAALEREAAWARAHPSWFNLELFGEAAAFHGRVEEAMAFIGQARARAMEDGQAQTADELLLLQAEILHTYGRSEEAKAAAFQIHHLTSSDAAELAVLRLQFGDVSAANAFLVEAQTLPRSSLVQLAGRPLVESALARPADPAKAAQILEPVANFLEADYWNPRRHAEAVTEARGCAAAMPDWQRITEHPGVDPVSVSLPLAKLAMARCYAHSNRFEESRALYAEVLRIWKDADASLPLVQQARQESAALERNT